jgi:hypothetical protein
MIWNKMRRYEIPGGNCTVTLLEGGLCLMMIIFAFPKPLSLFFFDFFFFAFSAVLFRFFFTSSSILLSFYPSFRSFSVLAFHSLCLFFSLPFIPSAFFSYVSSLLCFFFSASDCPTVLFLLFFTFSSMFISFSSFCSFSSSPPLICVLPLLLLSYYCFSGSSFCSVFFFSCLLSTSIVSVHVRYT